MLVSATLSPAAGTSDGPLVGDDVGNTLVGIQGGGVRIHKYGAVVMFDANGERVWQYKNAKSYFDVSRLENGSVMAGFMDDGYQDCGEYDSPCTHTGFRIIEPDPEPHVVFEYSFPVRTPTNSEIHDVERLPNGEFVLTDMAQERVFTVAPNGSVTWQWNASQFYDAPPNPTRTDWLHINDVDRIGEGRYLVSVRNANQLVIVERGEGVVDVVNEDRDPELFREQHNPQWLGSNAILVADSRNNRIVEVHRNESTGEWEAAWTLTHANGIRLEWPRDADRLPNGNTLITDSVNRRIVEVDRRGNAVWNRRTNYIPYEAERIPSGETVGGELYNPPKGADTYGNQRTDRMPVISPALRLIETVYRLPFWFREWQLLGSFLGLALVGGGAWLRWTSRADDGDRPARSG